MHYPTDRITHTTAFVTPVVEHWLEREIAQWVHPMKDRSDDPSHHERTLYLSLSYVPLPSRVFDAESWFVVYVFVKQLNEVAINIGKPPEHGNQPRCRSGYVSG